MGYEDRDYYQQEFKGGYQDSYTQRSIGTTFDSKSMIVKIIILNVVIFLIDTFTPIVSESKTQWLSFALGLKTDQLWQFWGFLTHGFAHASIMTETGVMHVIFNMLGLFFLGFPVEHRLGKFEFLRFYLAGILVSGLGWLAIHLTFFEQSSFLVGASGGVSAVIAYFIFMAPKMTLYLMGLIPMPAWLVGVLLLVANLLYAINPDSLVAWEAHLTGAAFGYLYFRFGWNLSRFDFGLERLLSKNPNLKLHDPAASEEKLRAEGDRILAKINEQGENSLTWKERRTLKKYSAILRRSREN
ncbi:MAG: rhomboid family intramembrane serine protease [Planctomycetota bacterium]